MKKDEFNVEKIVNEEDSLSFEFGSTQDAEFTSYSDNSDNLRDEVNDNPTSNETKRQKKKENQRKKEESSKKESNQSNNQSPESTISSSTATVSTIVGASLVSVATLSTLVGVNLFFNGKCQMNHVESTTNAIVYELDLTDINEDECIIKLEGTDYTDIQELKEGNNTGEFLDLTPSTRYRVSVVDITYNNYLLYEDYVSTQDEEPILTFTVTFITDGGSTIESQTINSGETVTRPDDPSKEHYTFAGWYSDSSYTQEYDFNEPVTGDISIYAKWSENPLVTISFEANGGEGEMESAQEYLGEEYIVPDCGYTAPSGYIFDCWQLASNADQYNPGDPYQIKTTASITFIAVWIEAARIEFYPGMGAQGSVTSIQAGIGKEYEIPSGEDLFTPPTNKEFNYWFDDMYSEQRHAGDVITIEDTYYSFTAQWKYLDGLTFTVTFDSNGGSEVEPQVVVAGERATRPEEPTKDGYKFDGWYTDAELTNSYNFFPYVEDDLVLYAKWLELYTVTFVTGEDATQIEAQQIASGKYATKPEDPTRGVYSFVGQDICTDSYQPYYGYEVDTGFSFDKYGYNYMCNTTAIPGEIVSVSLYTFSCQKISITYNVGFGTSQLSGRSTAGGGSYELAGGSDHAFENTIEGATYFSISANEYDNGGDSSAVACIDKVVVTYKLGTGDATSTITFDSFDGLLPGYTDSDPVDFTSSSGGDYSFAGWFLDSALTEAYDFDTPVTEDITLYAKWTATYSVSGAAFNGFPNSTVGYATESEVGGVNLQVAAYSCYYNDQEDGHGLWIPLGYDSQHPDDPFTSYLANKTPINGSIKSIAITVGPSAYGGTSLTTLHVTFGTEPMLEHLVSGTTITYESDATIVVDCALDGSTYFNITNVSERGLVIESIVITYYVNN